MRCPVCRTSHMTRQRLEERLEVSRCGQCGGMWIGGEQYWRWLEAHGPQRVEKPPEEGVDLPVQDSGAGKLCPHCGRFLTRHKVGHGVEFHLDRCAGCGGIWFDANEWEVLKSRNLHDEVHFIFSSAWQAEVARQEHQKRREQLLEGRIGAADLAEIRRIRDWLEQHPHRAELYAFLLQDHLHHSS